VLNGRARIGRQPQGDDWQSVIIVEICGTIEAPDDEHEVDLEITLTDVTDRTRQPIPALSRPKTGSIQQAPPFHYRTEMGKLCHRTSVLEDWTAVAQLSPEWFVLGRRGHRNLQYDLAIVSRSTGDPLAGATCVAPYENIEIGYLDIEDNIERAQTLAVGLAFSVAVVDDTLSEPGVRVIHDWVTSHFGATDATAAARGELGKALQKTATFFQRGGRLNLSEICAEIAEIVLEYYDREGMTGEILGVASTLALKAEIQTAYFELLLRRKEWTTVKDILEYHVKCNSHPITNLSRAMLNVDNEGELPPELLKLACEKGTNLNTIIDIFSLLVERKAWREVEDVMKSESSHWCKAMKGVIEKKDSVPLQISGFEC